MTEFSVLVDPLLEEIELDYEGLRVVAVGGGHGLAQALEAVLQYGDVITALVGVADDGGSSGRLVGDLDIPPPGDLRKALLALSTEDSVWRQLLDFRFSGADVAGHSLGNLIIAALAEMSGDFEDGLRTVGRLLGSRGAVIPIALQPLQLEAIIDGSEVVGQELIQHTPGRLERLTVSPDDVTATAAALGALETADQIVIGPGSLVTSLAAGLVVPGMTEAINDSPAQVIYVCNLTTQDAESLGLDALGHVRLLMDHTGLACPDVVVAHHGDFDIPAAVAPVPVDVTALEELGATVEMADLVDRDAEWPHHDPARLGAVLRRLA